MAEDKADSSSHSEETEGSVAWNGRRQSIGPRMKIRQHLDSMEAESDGHELVQEPHHWRTVCVDFDGVLNDSSGPFQRGYIGPPIPEGIALLRKLIERGWTVVILTARKEIDIVAGWLKEQGFPGLLVTNHKVPAQAYVDDRGVHWGPDATAEDIITEIESRPGR